MRVLVRLPNWLGDLLMTRPLLHAVRAAFPEAELWAIGNPASRMLERDQVWQQWRSLSDVQSERTASSALEGIPFDAALIVPASFSSAWMLRRHRIARRVGFGAEGRSWLLTDAIARPSRGDLHLSEEYLRLGAPLGIEPAAIPPLRPTEDDLDRARARLDHIGVAERSFAILGPGAAYGPAKRWGFGRFATLGRRFVARGWSVLVAGSQADRSIAVRLATAIGEGAHALAGQTSLEEQLALCAAARVTVSNDSGLAHLAAAAGAPTVAIFGSTSSAWTAPLGPRVVVVQRAPVCSPCFQRTCAIGYRCLEAIDVARVERAASAIAA